MKTQAIRTTSFHNEEHFQFFTDINKLFAGAPEAVKAALGDSLSQFESLHQREDAAIEQMRKNAHTKSLAELDARRDALYKGLCLLVEAYGYSPAEGELQAAARMEALLEHYGDFTRASYNKESATLYNFVQELNDRYSAEVDTLHARTFVQELGSANTLFQETMDMRHDDKAANQVENLRALRLEADALYRKMTSIIDASIIINGEANFAEFVNRLNERIAYYKNMLAVRKGRADKN
jgi:hypothetical protein